MENEKFTPGPWEVESGGRGSWIGNGNRYAALSCGPTDEEAQANGRLISKAPEMYDILFRLSVYEHVDFEEIQKLVKQATEESQPPKED